MFGGANMQNGNLHFKTLKNRKNYTVLEGVPSQLGGLDLPCPLEGVKISLAVMLRPSSTKTALVWHNV